ncbi:hypothetical protein VDG1235_1096 [Verrucomicrobiia bacterium DG1235]|nr:hypothetical protein VDG1235_1096 [Verrucomicrobiae bacterium DG1235]
MKHLYAILIAAFAPFTLFAQNTESDFPEKGMIHDKKMLHVGIVVEDIDASIEHWTAFLGLDEKPNSILAAGDSKNPTQYQGHLSGAQAKLAFFNLENLQIELIQPLGDDKSHWHDFLDTKGEGVHHLAFEVKGIGEGYKENYQKAGLPIVQSGGWESGEYAYADSMEALGVIIELLENYE